jgi:hypothetical protein
MKRLLVAALTSGLLMSVARAQEFDEPRAWIRPLVGIGYSVGGSTIQHTTLTPVGSSTHYEDDISAGAGIEFSAGLVLRIPGTPLSLKGTLGHHVDGAHGITLQSSFWRTPFEGGLQWHLSERATIGAGLRHAVRAKYQSSGGTCTDNTGVESPCPNQDIWLAGTYGWYLEGEWAVYPGWGLRLQAVKESFTFKPPLQQQRFKGDHIGLMSVFYFN